MHEVLRIVPEGPREMIYKVSLMYHDHVPEAYRESILVGFVKHTRLAFRHDPEYEPTWRHWYDGFTRWIGPPSHPEFENKIETLIRAWNVYEKLSALDIVIKYSQKTLNDTCIRGQVLALIQRLGKEDEIVQMQYSPERIQQLTFLHLDRLYSKETRNLLGIPEVELSESRSHSKIIPMSTEVQTVWEMLKKPADTEIVAGTVCYSLRKDPYSQKIVVSHDGDYLLHTGTKNIGSGAWTFMTDVYTNNQRKNDKPITIGTIQYLDTDTVALTYLAQNRSTDNIIQVTIQAIDGKVRLGVQTVNSDDTVSYKLIGNYEPAEVKQLVYPYQRRQSMDIIVIKHMLALTPQFVPTVVSEPAGV